MSGYRFSNKSLQRLETVKPELQLLFKEALKRSPIDFGIPQYGGLRTIEQQQDLYAQGRTEPGSVVTKVDGIDKVSRHQSGEAVDVYAYINGKASWDRTHLAIIAGVVYAMALELGIDIEWGGTFGSNDFHGWDYPHYQLKK